MTTKDEIKNRISMALKDPILQQGFEIICKENTELKAGKGMNVATKWHDLLKNPADVPKENVKYRSSRRRNKWLKKKLLKKKKR